MSAPHTFDDEDAAAQTDLVGDSPYFGEAARFGVFGVLMLLGEENSLLITACARTLIFRGTASWSAWCSFEAQGDC